MASFLITHRVTTVKMKPNTTKWIRYDFSSSFFCNLAMVIQFISLSGLIETSNEIYILNHGVTQIYFTWNTSLRNTLMGSASIDKKRNATTAYLIMPSFSN